MDDFWPEQRRIAMTERPILFSTRMVRAILDGRKTQTRRAVKLPKTLAARGADLNAASTFRDPGFGDGEYLHVSTNDGCVERVRCPYADTPGNRLWVRETWGLRPFSGGEVPGIVYRAGADWRGAPMFTGILQGAWRPSIHLSRGDSRIALEVTAVRVERLQDISEADAIAEGLRWRPAIESWTAGDDNWPTFTDPRRSYAGLWEAINGPGSWGANPWVWVVEFRRIEGRS